MIEPLLFSYVFITAFLAVVALIVCDKNDGYAIAATLGGVFIWPIVLPIFMVMCVCIFITRIHEELSK